MDTLRFDRISGPLGDMLVVVADDQLVGLDFADHETRLRRLLERRYPDARYREQRDPLRLHAALERYFDGDFASLNDVPLAAGGTHFEARAWAALRLIPPGATRSYAQQAAQIGAPTAARAIGAANGRKPISIVIPCHRVIGSNGALTGYAGGVARKRWLLDHERAAAHAVQIDHATTAAPNRLAA